MDVVDRMRSVCDEVSTDPDVIEAAATDGGRRWWWPQAVSRPAWDAVAAAPGPAHGVLADLKRALDPAGVLKPGKLGRPAPFGDVDRPQR